jgi:hypothetical protein
MIQFLPHPLSDIQLADGGDLKPVITGQFILIPNPGKCDPAKPYHVTFRAKVAG